MNSISDVLSADDVQIKCSVRKAKLEDKKDLSEPEDMLCTMRLWHSPNPGKLNKIQSSTGKRLLGDGKEPQNTCEIILRPLERHPSAARANSRTRREHMPVQMSKRFSSFGSGLSKFQMQEQQQSPGLGNINFPISEIMIVDIPGDSHSLITNLTTMSHGYFEFTMLNRNGQEILLAFLKANLPNERIMGCSPRSPSDMSYATSNASVDVEAFTENRMTERIKNETLSEKVRRKVGRAFASIEELTANMSECACTFSKTPKDSIEANEMRDSPPRNDRNNKANNDDFDNYTSEQKQCIYDCGLSVESEPETELAH